jgi:hypothetical protein
MLYPVRNIVALTPVYNETLGMIQVFQRAIDAVREPLNRQGIAFRHFFLDDGALELPDESSILIRHVENQGLARTLGEGYHDAVFRLKSRPDVVVRLDCQEHDPAMILESIDHLGRVPVDAVFLPVVYNVKGESCKRRVDITLTIAELSAALNPPNIDVIKRIYNQVFPLGYQVFRTSLLEEILPKYQQALTLYQEIYHKPPTWGFDLLAMIFAAQIDAERIDFLFGGWMEPWLANRGLEKVEAQRDRVEKMLALCQRLGVVSENAEPPIIQ